MHGFQHGFHAGLSDMETMSESVLGGPPWAWGLWLGAEGAPMVPPVDPCTLCRPLVEPAMECRDKLHLPFHNGSLCYGRFTAVPWAPIEKGRMRLNSVRSHCNEQVGTTDWRSVGPRTETVSCGQNSAWHRNQVLSVKAAKNLKLPAVNAPYASLFHYFIRLVS